MVALSVLLGAALLFWTWLLFTTVARLPHYPGTGFGGFWTYWAENSAEIDQPLILFTAVLLLLAAYLFLLFMANPGTRRRGLLAERTALGAGFLLIAGMATVTDDLIDIVTGRYSLAKWHDTIFGPDKILVPVTYLNSDPEARYWAQIGEQWVFLPDADTIRFGQTDYRLWGIDALQAEQRCQTGDHRPVYCGQQARDAFLKLMSSVPASQISCYYPDQDRYPRTISCRAGDRDAADWLVRHGHAFPTGAGRYRYGDAGRAAAAHKRGAWATTFLYPRQWIAARCESISGFCRKNYTAD